MRMSSLRLSILVFCSGLGAVASTVLPMLSAKNGMTLYVFDADANGIPSCYAACALKWPPALAKTDETMGKDWSTVERRDGSLQWTYRDRPLYFYVGDKKTGDKTGDGIGGKWHIVSQ